MLSQRELLYYIAGYPETTPRTKALERRIKIGSGFHNKWYRSQREHWLGWLVAKDGEARKKGVRSEDVWAGLRWRHLMCSPAMFWLADCAGVDERTLVMAEGAAARAANLNNMDGHPHGKLMREAISWGEVQTAIISDPFRIGVQQAEIEALEAFDRLCRSHSKFRPLRDWLKVCDLS